MPWRNGLGTTVELLKHELSDGSGFAWRLSMADVSSDGEFSNFSGYDRTLLLLEGNGLTLDCAGSVHRLEEPLEAARFRGEDATVATLHDGPIKDFNIMTRRSHCSAEVNSQVHTGATQIELDAELLLVYAVAGDLCIELLDNAELLIPTEHLLVVDRPASRLSNFSGAGFIATQIRFRDQAN